MRLVEKHLITFENQNFKTLDKLCFLSKNLYNYANYLVRQEFINNKKWLRYIDLQNILKNSNQVDYRALPNNSSQQLLRLLEKNWKSFFESVKDWKKNPNKYLGRPKLPGYLDKNYGRNIICFTSQQFRIKNSYIHFPKMSTILPIKTKQRDIKLVRIVPWKGVYKIEVVYDVFKRKYKNNYNYLSIDLGLKNLCAITSNLNFRPILVNGGKIKSINSFYNKKISKMKGELKVKNNKDWSKQLTILNLKRENKLEFEFHKISNFIIQFCKNHNITNIVVGKNKNWKQEIKLGKRNNQNFVYISFEKLIYQLNYKAEKIGMKVETVEESYTSKCSSLDLEPIQKHQFYLGERIKRGLFKDSTGRFINADINASLNILRKVNGDAFIRLLNTGFVMNPLKLTF